MLFLGIDQHPAASLEVFRRFDHLCIAASKCSDQTVGPPPDGVHRVRCSANWMTVEPPVLRSPYRATIGLIFISMS